MVAAIPARIKFTLIAGEAVGIKQVIDFFLERGSTHHARFINLVVDSHYRALCAFAAISTSHSLPEFFDNPYHSECLIDCITVAFEGGKMSHSPCKLVVVP